MPTVKLVLSDSKGEQWGVFEMNTTFIPRRGEYIHYLSEESGNAVFHVLFVQHVAESKGAGPAQLYDVPYIHVEISEDDEPLLSGTFRAFAESLKRSGAQLHQRDQRGW